MAPHQPNPCPHHADAGDDEHAPAHVHYECPELRDETTALLRSRLHKVPLIFLLGFSVFLIASYLVGRGPIQVWTLWTGVIFYAAVAAFLRRPVCLSFRGLRLFEAAMFGAMGTFHVVRHFAVVDELVVGGDPAL